MYYYLDEAGDFALPATAAEHRASVVVSIAISEVAYDAIKRDYGTFVRSLPVYCFDEGEPRGKLLKPDHKRRFCAMLSRFEGAVSITPVTLDLSALVGTSMARLSQEMKSIICREAQRCVYPEMRDHVDLLGRRFGNLSTQQGLRLYSWANCMREALEHSILFLSTGGHERSWSAIRFEVDAVTAAGTREEQVFTLMILMWLTAWSRSKPLGTIKEIHTHSHPFVSNYCVGSDGVDLGKLLRGNIHFVKSHDSFGVQLADIAASIVYAAVMHPQDATHVDCYRRLMANSFYGANRGPGLFGPDESAVLTAKYRPLAEAMRRRHTR